MKEKWMLAQKKADFDRLAARHNISPVIVRLMINRGVTEEEMETYLHGGLDRLHSPYLMKHMERAADLLITAITQNKKIAIASDFDCDGIFSSIIFHFGLKEAGANTVIYTPNRLTEGYGLNERIIDEAKASGAELLLTCDNGIAAIDQIQYARDLGMQVIVTDHHEVTFEIDEAGEREYILPNTEATVNPRQPDCNYPCTGICGAAVAFKLIEVIYDKRNIKKEKKNTLLQYVAIATITDVMDLTDENRILVKYGLERLRRSNNIGLKAIMEVNKIFPKELSAYHIGFILGPCFNAAGRLDTVKTALDLLLCQDKKRALKLAFQLKEFNDKRKLMTVTGCEQAIKQIEESGIYKDKVLLVVLKNCHESLAGIIAGRVREKYHKPCFVFTETEQGLKGSGRSIEAYNMFEGLVACRDLLNRFGGHPMAAGLSLSSDKIEVLRKRLNLQASLTEEDFEPIVHIDVNLPIGFINEDFIEELKILEPFGKGNVKPLFAERHFKVLQASYLGKDSNFIKMRLMNEFKDEIEALYFGDANEFRMYVEHEFGIEETEKMFSAKPNRVDLAFTYYPSLNEYNGYRTLQIIIQHYCRVK